MPTGYRGVILAAFGFLVLGNAEQHRGQHQQQPNQGKPAKPVAIPEAPNAKPTDNAQQECYAGSGKGISCDSIAAKAAVDQARDADEQAAAVPWQTGMGIGTLLAAMAAAIFAWFAIKETRRIGEAQSKAYLSIAKVKGSRVESGLAFWVKLQNAGPSPAIEVCSLCTIVGPDGFEQEIPMHRWNDYVPANSTKYLPIIYFSNTAAHEWDGIMVKIGIGYADVFNTIYKFNLGFAGSPKRWRFNKPSSLVSVHNIVSVFDAGVVPRKNEQGDDGDHATPSE
jgi:hypothetical protein